MAATTLKGSITVLRNITILLNFFITRRFTTNILKYFYRNSAMETVRRLLHELEILQNNLDCLESNEMGEVM
jgi:hypothetical protein